MSDMLKRYNESTAPMVVDARDQACGAPSTAVNVFDVEATHTKDGFVTREKGDTTVAHSNADDDTKGNFSEEALSHYDEEVNQSVEDNHKYNRSNEDSHYVNKHLSAPGTLVSATPSN